MTWYLAENLRKNLRQVVVEIGPGADADSKFGVLAFAGRYGPLMIAPWTAGIFRLEQDQGPYLLVRGDGVIDDLRGSPLRVGFSFFRMPTGGVFAWHVEVDCPAVTERLIYPQVLFEATENPADALAAGDIGNLLSRESLHFCFAEGNGSGEIRDGAYAGPPLSARFDVVAKLMPECRDALAREWESLLSYQVSIPRERVDFRVALKQMRVENPQNSNPFEPRRHQGVVGRLAEGRAAAGAELRAGSTPAAAPEPARSGAPAQVPADAPPAAAAARPDSVLERARAERPTSLPSDARPPMPPPRTTQDAPPGSAQATPPDSTETGSPQEMRAPFWSGSLFEDDPSEGLLEHSRPLIDANVATSARSAHGPATVPLGLDEDGVDDEAPLRAGIGDRSSLPPDALRGRLWWQRTSTRVGAAAVVGVLAGTAGTWFATRQDGADRSMRIEALRREAAESAPKRSASAPTPEKAQVTEPRHDDSPVTADASTTADAAGRASIQPTQSSRLSVAIASSKSPDSPAAATPTPAPSAGDAMAKASPKEAIVTPPGIESPPSSAARAGGGEGANAPAVSAASPAPVASSAPSTPPTRVPRPTPAAAELPSRDLLITVLRNKIAEKLSSSASSISGASVVVRVSFTPSGMLDAASVTQRSGHPEFDAEVLRALRAAQPFGVVKSAEAARKYEGLTFLFANPGTEERTGPPGIAPPIERRAPDLARPAPAAAEGIGPQALYEAARQQLKSGANGDARIRLEELLKRYPDSTYAPKAMYELAGILQRAGDNGSARDTYADLARRYPGSAEAQQARRFLAAPR